jgi:outer membrane receptor for ferrienterochelin and colicins
MHIAFAGGGVSRIRLSDALREERSNSLSASYNFDKATENFKAGFTIEGFYTRLHDSFVLEEVGTDDFGTIFEKRNAAGSLVRGVTVELRGNYKGKAQLEAVYTYQKSNFENPVSYSSTLPAVKHYLRSPDKYGYYTITLTPQGRFNASISGVYTGRMEVLHFAGAPQNPVNDRYVTTRGFLENNVKLIYLSKVIRLNLGLEIFGGIKNIFDAYQDDFDTGKNRDSNYVYGPSTPRTYYFGVKFGSI